MPQHVQVIVDMMAGIGPFAVPAAQRGCQVSSLKALHPGAARVHTERRRRRGFASRCCPSCCLSLLDLTHGCLNGSGCIVFPRIAKYRIAKYPMRSMQTSRGACRTRNFDMQVYANDLNPRSSHYLDINVKLNKVPSLCSI